MKDVAIGIDIGGTNTVYGFIDSEGNCLGAGSIETQSQEQFEDYLNDLFVTIEQSIKESNQELNVIGVGIGAPNANYKTGTITDAANLRWQGVLELVPWVEERLHVPVKLTNDANAAALGERIFGGAKGMSDFMMVTLGTGLGSGLVVNGDLLYGHDGLAGELGHIIVRPNGRQCGCGRRGCLETYVSATGVQRTAYEMLSKYLDRSSLRDVPFNQLTAKMVTDAANNGDFIAKETFAYTGKMLGEAFANMAAIINPEAIFFFGGLAKAGDLLFTPTYEAMEKNILFFYKNKIKLLASELGNNAAILGAAALIWNNRN